MQIQKLTKRATYIIGLFVVLLASAVLTISFGSLSTQGENRHVAVGYLIRTSELDHALRESILEAHAFRVANYDHIVAITKEMQAICPAILGAGDAFLVAERPEISGLLKEYCRLSDQVLNSVEHFKSKNAVLRNSIRYFPVLVSGFTIHANKIRALTLHNDILLHCLQPTKASLNAVDSDIKEFQARLSVASADKVVLTALLNHAKIAVGAANERTQFESQIGSPALKNAVSRLSETYISATDDLERRSHRLKTGAVTLSAVLLIMLLVLLYHLQQTARSLSELNTNLESTVERRTRELKRAMSDLELQQQVLAHATKMSALGEMAGGIAHEINSPLAAISLKAETLLIGNHSPSTEKSLNEIVSIVQRIAKIVLGLRRFSREDESAPLRPTSISSVIEDTLCLCSQKFKSSNVHLIVEEPEPVVINCVPEQISQVLLNLLNNSFDAVSNEPEKWVRVSTKLRGGDLYLSVTDSGPGIPEAIQAKLTQPFFTTKAPGKGTGIGLSISKGIIEKHGGELAYDRSCANTTFVVRLSAAAKSLAA